jgi:hypothetical protein
MADIQMFETTVADRETGYSFRFLSIPNRSISSNLNGKDLQNALKDALNLQSIQPLRASDLSNAIMAMVQVDKATDEEETIRTQAILNQFVNPRLPPPPPPDLLQFAEEVAFAEIIPFEESPLSLVSLAGKVAGYAKNPIAMGAFIGVLAGGTSLLLLVTVPAGIILCGAASAFVKVLDERRDDLLSKVCGLPPKKTRQRRGYSGGGAGGPGYNA